ncbi:carbamoyltransferase C-terminal domain-containing protein [Bradyrhizobium sp. STM 3561]|uniref:carbamoyltransferase C-terminal domain-containing protein n=1 Tax=Bradyrhizobium sp. STM 3561 TaxID=578923 RepID=UPI00388FFF50
MIGELAKATPLPVLINTSLNTNEQPTVNAPLKALHTYSARAWTCSISAINDYRSRSEITARPRSPCRRWAVRRG